MAASMWCAPHLHPFHGNFVQCFSSQDAPLFVYLSPTSSYIVSSIQNLPVQCVWFVVEELTAVVGSLPRALPVHALPVHTLLCTFVHLLHQLILGWPVGQPQSWVLPVHQ